MDSVVSIADLSMDAAPTSRTDLIYEAIRRAILTGELPAGQVLVERELAARLKVSKTPVREALIALARSGLIDVERNRSPRVVTLTRAQVKDVYDLRRLLEPHAVVEGIGRWSDTELAQAQTLLADADRAAATGQRLQHSLINREFHRIIYSKSPNATLRQILDNLQDRVALMTVLSWNTRPTWRTEGDQHKRILAAINSGDRQTAHELVLTHVSDFADLAIHLAESADGARPGQHHSPPHPDPLDGSPQLNGTGDRE